MNIAMMGTGYVGLVTGACFADAGHQVHCFDRDEEKAAALKQGRIPIHEPGLEELVKTNLARGNLHFCDKPEEAIEACEIIFIAVGTPPDEDGSADLQHVLAVAETIGRHMNGEKIIVNKSTVPVGTADQVEETIKAALEARGAAHVFGVCSNPEFLKEGSAVEDFSRPARILIGAKDERAKQLLEQCYAPFGRNRDKILFMDVRSAELTKYAANAILATKISFINEIAHIAESVGADIEKIRLGIGSDPRIGYDFIYPGAGYGGSCFPKDVRALAHTARANGVEPRMLEAVEQINEAQKRVLFKKLSASLGDVSGKKIALWGLAFKPNTDDMRNAPSLTFIEEVLKANGIVRAFDPIAMESARRILQGKKDFELCESRYDATQDADALVICTEWNEFRVIDFDILKERMRTRIIIDGRNIADAQKAREEGFTYLGIGR